MIQIQRPDGRRVIVDSAMVVFDVTVGDSNCLELQFLDNNRIIVEDYSTEQLDKDTIGRFGSIVIQAVWFFK